MSQPFRMSNTKPLVKLMRSRNESGSVNASTRPPRSAAMSPPVSWCCTLSQFCVYTCSRFQLSGRSAAALMSLISSNVSRVNSPTCGMNSSVVPGNSPTTRHSSTSSSRDACRDGTGTPVWSLCDDDHVDENPMPPAASPSRSRRFISSSSAGVDSRAVASSCITTRRSAEWPTRNPAFGISVPSSRSRYCSVERPVPRHALLQRLQRHALDAGQHPHQVVGIAGSTGPSPRRAARS